jgi:WD40 repeat protein
MRISWAVGHDADPRLERLFRGVRGETAVPAVVEGAAVWVTAAEDHDDDSCARPGSHDCAESMVQVWDAVSGSLVSTAVVAGAGRLVVTSVDGRPVAVSRPRYYLAEAPVAIDLGTGRVIGPLSGHRDTPVRRLVAATLPGSQAVVSVTSEGIVRVVPSETGAVRQFDTGLEIPFGMTVLPVNGRAVVALGGDDVQLWDLETGRAVGTVATGPVRALTSWADGSALIGVQGRDDTVAVWDAGSGRRVCVADAGSGPMVDDCVAAVLSEDGRRVLAVADGEVVHLYDVAAGAALGPPVVGPTRDCTVTAAGAGRLVTICPADETLAVWRVASAPPRDDAPTGDLRCLAVTPDGRILTGGSDGKIDAWRLDDGRREGTRATLAGRVNAVASVPTSAGQMVVAAGGHVLHRWLNDGPDQPFPLAESGETRQMSTAVADGRLLALTLGCSRDVQIHDLLTGEEVGAFDDGSFTLGFAVGDLGGRPVAAVTRLSPVFQLWDIAAAAQIETPLTESVSWGDLVHAVIDAPGGPAVVLVEGGRRVVVRDLTTDASVHIDSDDSGHVTALSARGESVAVARIDGSVAMHQLPTGKLVGTLTLPHPATALTWTPAGDLVIATRRALLLAGI